MRKGILLVSSILLLWGGFANVAFAGFGITRLLNYQVAAQIRGGQLKVMLEDFETAPLPMHVVHHEGRRATQKVRGFIELAIETLRADPALE